MRVTVSNVEEYLDDSCPRKVLQRITLRRLPEIREMDKYGTIGVVQPEEIEPSIYVEISGVTPAIKGYQVGKEFDVSLKLVEKVPDLVVSEEAINSIDLGL